jgi:2-amino-4-hydroxy-6-hydroxymethyldihydropteridine diphosphokinase
METAYIGFGSNVGDRIDFCDRAVTLLSLLPHSRVAGISMLYETEPVHDGTDPGDGWFLNGVVQLETDVTPRSLLMVSTCCFTAIKSSTIRTWWYRIHDCTSAALCSSR